MTRKAFTFRDNGYPMTMGIFPTGLLCGRSASLHGKQISRTLRLLGGMLRITITPSTETGMSSDISLDKDVSGLVRDSFVYLGVTLLIVLIVLVPASYLGTLIMKGQIVDPVITIAQATRKYMTMSVMIIPPSLRTNRMAHGSCWITRCMADRWISDRTWTSPRLRFSL